MDVVNELFCWGGIDLERYIKVFWCDTMLLLVCPTKRILCLQGHMLLRTGLPHGSFFLFLVTCSLCPYIAMNSVSDYKVRRGRREEKRRGLSQSVFSAVGFLTGRQCSMFNSDNTVWYHFYQVRKVQRRQWHPIPVLLPGKSHGRRSLVGCSPWGR